MTFFLRAVGSGFRSIQWSAPIHSRCFSITASNQIAERLRFSSPISNAQIKHYSATSVYPGITIDRGKSTYIKLHEGTDQEKTKRVFLHTFENTLRSLDLAFVEGSLAPEKSWDLLQNHLSEHHSYQLTSFNPDNSLKNIQELLKMFRRPLIKENRALDKPILSDYIFTPTEFAWEFAPVGVPFTGRNPGATTDLSKIQDILDQCPFPEALPRTYEKLSETDQKVQRYSLLNSEKDATAATLLATAYLDKTTLLHEMGCWNGQNLLNLLFYASLKGRAPTYCVGTDINYKALTMAQSVSSLLSIHEPFAQFHLSNALHPLDVNYLRVSFDKEVRLALRLIPILEPSRAKTFLSKMRSSFKSSKDVAIVSYAVPKGQRYEENLRRVRDSKQPQFTKEDFSGGVAFLQESDPKDELPSYLQESQNHRAIINTYYTVGGFSSLAQECGFEIQHAISVHDADNERVVAALSPK